MSQSNEDDIKTFFEFAESQKDDYSAAYYDKDGDCIEFLARPVNFYAERVDNLVTVYYSEKNNEIVGSLVKGVSKILKQHPNLALIISGDKIRVSHLFVARLMSEEKQLDQITIKIYQKLIDCAEQTKAEAKMCPA